MRKIKFLIDAGHGVDTKGKQSPDGRLREYKYTREIAQRLVDKLKANGQDAERLVPEDTDVKLVERCRRANAWCDKLGSKNVVLLSIHNNAAGNGGWYNAQGWMCLVDDAASKNAKDLASLLFDEVARRGLKTRQYKAGQKWYLYSEALGKKGVRLAILRGTKCPAVLTENFFQDNKAEVDWLLSEQGKQTLVDIHYDALMKYAETH